MRVASQYVSCTMDRAIPLQPGSPITWCEPLLATEIPKVELQRRVERYQTASESREELLGRRLS
jgi:hypothetical protein